jgi:hypothetical protein
LNSLTLSRIIVRPVSIAPDVVRIEFVIEIDAQDVVRDARIECHRSCRIRCRRRDSRYRSQIEVEVLDFGGPFADEATFDAATERPARVGIVAADDRDDRIAVGVKAEDRAGGLAVR